VADGAGNVVQRYEGGPHGQSALETGTQGSKASPPPGFIGISR
jgi:hypothetical protein